MKLDGKRILLITNPNSRSGREVALNSGVDALENAGATVVQTRSRSAEHMNQEIRSMAKRCDLIVIGGGDGTISSAAEVLYEIKKPFAILPLGTANDLAKSLDVPLEIDNAFNLIIQGNTRKVNLGEVNGKFFFNVANIGLGVSITHELTAELKKKWGVISYLRAFLSCIARTKRFKVRLKVDGKSHKLRSIQLAVGNGRYYGGGNIIDEQSFIDDGTLSLYSLRPQTFWELITLAPILRHGKTKNVDKRIFRARGTEVIVKTHRTMEVHADGEAITHTPATFKVLPEALEVISPENFDVNPEAT